MKIQLKNWKVKGLSFTMNGNTSKDSKQNVFGLSIGHSFSDDEDKEFGIGFKLEIEDIEFQIKIEMLFIFEVDQNLTDELKQSDFININAPAIAFPYVRSYISNLTLQSGFKPIMLPSVNFVEMQKRRSDLSK